MKSYFKEVSECTSKDMLAEYKAKGLSKYQDMQNLSYATGEQRNHSTIQ